MRRAKPISVKVKAPSRGLVTRWPTDTADLISPADANRVCVVAQNVRFEDGVMAAAPGYERVGTNSLFTGLVAHWKLNEAPDEIRKDSHSSYDLHQSGSITVGSVSGKIGNAAHFTDPDGFLYANSTDQILGIGNFTVAGWVKFDSEPATEFGVITFPAAPIGDGRILRIRAVKDGDVFIEAVLQTTSGLIVARSTYDVSTTGTWYFFRVWHNRVAQTLTVRVNENSSVDGVQTYAGALYYPAPTLEAVILGQEDTSSELALTGSIDSVSVWQRVLTAGEGTALYNAGAGLDFPFSLLDSEVLRVHQPDIIGSDSPPLLICTMGKIFTGVRNFLSSPRQFFLTLTQVFTGAAATLTKPWKVTDFLNKVILAQRSVAPQYWTAAAGIAPVPGLPASDTYDGVETFQKHVIFWKDATVKWSDLNDFAVYIPVAETVSSMRLTTTAAFTQPAVNAATGLIPVSEITTGLTVGQYVRIDISPAVNFYLVNAVAPSAGLSATLVAGGTQTITGSATTRIFITDFKLWETGQRVVSSVSASDILTVDSVNAESLVSYSLSDVSPVLPAVGTTFDVKLTDIKTELAVGQFISLGASALPNLDIFEITAVVTDPAAAKTVLTIKQKSLGSSILAVGSTYPVGTSVVIQPWVKLTKSTAGNISATASSTLTERYAVNLTLQNLTGITAPATSIASASVIVTLDANEAGEAQNVGSDINGPIFQVLSMGEYAYILKQRSIQSVQYVGRQSGTFFIRTEVQNEGLIGRNSYLKLDNGRMVFLGQRELYLYQGGQTPQPIAQQFTRQLYRELDRSKLDEIFLYHKDLRNEVWVVYPSNAATVRVLIFNYVENSVTLDDYEAALQKLTTAATVDWDIDATWASLPADLTWELEGETANRAWDDFDVVGVERVTLLGTQAAGSFALLLHGYSFSRDGAGYTCLAETQDFDLEDDTLFKYPECVHLGLQVRVMSTATRTLFVQVGTKASLDGDIVWSPVKSVSVSGNASPPIKINPVVRGGRFVRLRLYSTDVDVQWRVGFFEIFCRAGSTY